MAGSSFEQSFDGLTSQRLPAVRQDGANRAMSWYRAKGNEVTPPFHDLQARITLYWKFTKPQS